VKEETYCPATANAYNCCAGSDELTSPTSIEGISKYFTSSAQAALK
jgi:hypothetical protein